MYRKIYSLVLIFSLIHFYSLAQAPSSEISLSDIFKKSTFNIELAGKFHSMNDGEHYTVRINDSLNIYSYKTGKFKGNILTIEKLIADNGTELVQVENIIFSPNEKKLLLETETEKIYRRSNRSSYYIYNISTSRLSPLSSNGKQRLATFSPDGKKVAFVRGNNIFVKDLLSGNEISITNDGEINSIINGASDWVYEEEFGFSKAFFWSPNGKQIAYYKFNESHVKEYTLTKWGEIYPQSYSYKYPKAGEVNAIVSIWVYNIEDQISKKINTGDETDIYLPRVKWTKQKNTLSIQWMNRHQNELKILFANTSSGDTRTIYKESNKYYINIKNNLYFLDDNLHFIFTNETTGYHHIYLFDMMGNLINKITRGEWDVDEIVAIDEHKKSIYFTAGINSPINRELYSIQLEGSKMQMISKEEGIHKIEFSKKNNYYVDTWSTANTPPVVTINNPRGKIIRKITSSQVLLNTIEEFNFSPKTFFSFITSEEVKLNGWMIKPPDFNPEKKYPVLMYVYGGPGSQTVKNQWSKRDSWFQLLAQKGIIIVSVDNRGTGARGEAFKKTTYLQLGKYETLDQIEAAHYLSGLKYVDSARIGIWGWSYGGFLATSCLAIGADVFSMAIAVAPVSHWKYYDNIYTERFMRTPAQNPEGYNSNSPINHMDKIKGKFLLIHGTADDNVHYQNTMDLVTALVDADVQFEMQLYPNSNHGIYSGANTKYHLYTRMTNFILENLTGGKK